MYHHSQGAVPQRLPIDLQAPGQAVPKTMVRSPGHYEEWSLACKSGKSPVDDFNYSGPVTETVLLGVLAMRAPGSRLEWDSENLTVKNASHVNEFVHTEYRKGWTL